MIYTELVFLRSLSACLLLSLAAGCGPQNPHIADRWNAAARQAQASKLVEVNASIAGLPDSAGVPENLPAAPKINAARAMQYTREVTDIGPRSIGSAGHKKIEAYLRDKLKNDNLEQDVFTAQTPAGKFQMTNFITKYPGTKDGIIVICGHYDTVYSIKNFVGANDGGSSTGLLLELADQLRGRKHEGPSIWLVWFDGEEAVKEWTDSDSLYGSRHLAQKWQQEGILTKIRALILLDMVGDADLNIEHDQSSTSWLEDMLYQSATKLGYQSFFFGRDNTIDDDHIPFVKLGVPSVDIIDLNYGPNGSYWHTPKDTLDKLSPKSLSIAGNTTLELVWMLSAK